MKRLATTSGDLLVVDDDKSFRSYLSTLLGDSGFGVSAVGTGAAAVEAVRTQAPSLVILDVNLPGLSGYEVCRAIREDLGSDVPIIFVSGERTESFDRVAGLMIGADDYLAKPFLPDELLARVRCLLRRASSGRQNGNGLTSREQDVLGLLAEGLDQVAIAARLVLSESTVSKHIERILAKLGVHSRAQAVALAYRMELV